MLNCRRKLFLTGTMFLGMLFLQLTANAGEQLMSNGDFNQWVNGEPTSWKFVNNQQKIVEVPATDFKEGSKGSKVLGIEVIKDVAKKYGEIRQKGYVSATPNTEYKFSGWLKSSQKRACFFMIKLFKDSKEVKRIKIGSSTKEWAKAEETFNTGEADKLLVLCRYQQSANYVGCKCCWGKLKLEKVEKVN